MHEQSLSKACYMVLFCIGTKTAWITPDSIGKTCESRSLGFSAFLLPVVDFVACRHLNSIANDSPRSMPRFRLLQCALPAKAASIATMIGMPCMAAVILDPASEAACVPARDRSPLSMLLDIELPRATHISPRATHRAHSATLCSSSPLVFP